MVKDWNRLLRDMELNILGDMQNPTGWRLEEPAVVDPALSREAGQDDLQRSFPNSTILCESVKTDF